MLNNKEAIRSQRSDLPADKEELCGDKCHEVRLVPRTMVQETDFNFVKSKLKVFFLFFFRRVNLPKMNMIVFNYGKKLKQTN